MDWSAVYEDGGEEEGNWTEREIQNDRTTKLLHLFKLEGDGKYTPFICYAFTVNYILGVGCLGIPYAFLQCGIVLGSILVIVLSFISYITVMWVAAASQQEIQMTTYLNNSNPFILSPKVLHNSSQRLQSAINKNISYGTTTHCTSEQDLVQINTPPPPSSQYLQRISSFSNLYTSIKEYVVPPESNTINKLSDTKRYMDERRKEHRLHPKEISRAMQELEVTDLAYEFLGTYGKIVYQSSLMLLTYVGLLAYAQVFSSSFISQVWETSSIVPSLIFGMIVIPLSCVELSEQISVQVIMSLLRFLSLGILLFGTLLAIYLYPPSIENQHITDMSAKPLWKLDGFGVMFTTAIFSQLFQHSVPGLIRPLSKEDKKSVPMIFKYALITTSFIYISTGCVCVYYFGKHLKQSVNLNFINFKWGYDNYDNINHHTIHVNDKSTIYDQLTNIINMNNVIVFISMIVVLFPALDTLSVFPLIANTLGNNLNSAFPILAIWLKSNNLVEDQKNILVIWRLIAAIPPVLASIFVTDLMFSLQIAGLCGIIVALVTPALLQRQSEFRLSLIPVSIKAVSPIPNYYSDKVYSNSVLFIAILALIISIMQMFNIY